MEAVSLSDDVRIAQPRIETQQLAGAGVVAVPLMRQQVQTGILLCGTGGQRR
ncbi:hypothetical protein LJQ97_004858, partial [Salmonella enterica]|nr:hypothetical protein [Salmonella enterica]